MAKYKIYMTAIDKQTFGTVCVTYIFRLFFADIFALGLVQHIALVPLAVGALVGLADVKLHLGALLVLHGLPFVQGHLLGALLLWFLHLVLPGGDRDAFVIESYYHTLSASFHISVVLDFF